MGRMFDLYNRRSEETIWVDKGSFHMSVQTVPSSFEYTGVPLVTANGCFVQSAEKTIRLNTMSNQNNVSIIVGPMMSYYSLIRSEPVNCTTTRPLSCWTEPSRAYGSVFISV